MPQLTATGPRRRIALRRRHLRTPAAGRVQPDARVAQLDRASVYGTDSRQTEPPKPQALTQNAIADDSAPMSAQVSKPAITDQRSDPELAQVIEAWAGLPEALKAGIVAMVKAACPEPGRRACPSGASAQAARPALSKAEGKEQEP